MPTHLECQISGKGGQSTTKLRYLGPRENEMVLPQHSCQEIGLQPQQSVQALSLPGKFWCFQTFAVELS